ncbi:DUF1553 domain-containing protein [Tautonia marina]|uniref:DUF1553 domain-containing protein n=1 Tax=Tautonia marina TaxID=2653855 RepID=UPI001260DB77|nr:DUF1553 domain-containing protein [Tautonia marina]
MKPFINWLHVFLLIGQMSGFASGNSTDGEGVQFFETKIRPVLIEKCYRCHSVEADQAGKLKGGLLLDHREGLLLGGASGPAVVPGNVDESLLIDALRYDLLQMPPEGKLPETIVNDFVTWIEQGAPDPRTGDGAVPRSAEMDIEAGRDHWAYQPPRIAPVPDVNDSTWPRNDIDRFILARLEAEGLRPVSDADRITLIRRLSYDLVGLPPSPEEIQRFVLDRSPTAYEDLVDRFLASPHFGERWGRHWLDVARFGESLTLRGLVFKEAWRYRDYVIDAFNEDMPFDQFVREQIAGDLLDGETIEDRRRQIVATSFLVLGNTNLEEQDKEQLRMDMVDEQIETIGKALLAQTISCARCHDHKFDPIPTSDYYALAGILSNAKAMRHANVSAWIEVPLPMEADREAVIVAHEKSVSALEAQIKELRASLKNSEAGKGILEPEDVPGIVVDDEQADRVGEWKSSTYSGNFIGSGYLHDDNQGKGEKTLTFQPDLSKAGLFEVWIAYSPGASRASAVPITILSAEGESDHTIDMRQQPPIEGRYLRIGEFRFEANGQAYLQISNEGTRGHVTADAVVWIPAEQVASSAPSSLTEQNELARLESELKALSQNAPQRDMAMSVVEEDSIRDLKIHIRGSVHNLGQEVPRGFLRVATQSDKGPRLPEDESGRRQLADWVASPQNPLTARVLVNRVWHWLMGEGLVPSVDNFGTTGDSASHPELLDTLAVRFVNEGWSIKTLIRKIVVSRTYQLSTERDPSAERIDPENVLRWRMDRRRLDAESIRDTMLWASGQLDLEMSGPSFPETLAADYGFKSKRTRRSVYEPVFRNALPEVFEAFDFADPSLVVGRRNTSTVATQALFLMNHPFVIQQAQETAARLLEMDFNAVDDRISYAYQLILGRSPTEEELSIASRFVNDPTHPEEGSWSLLVQSIFATIDFRSIQ